MRGLPGERQPPRFVKFMHADDKEELINELIKDDSWKLLARHGQVDYSQDPHVESTPLATVIKMFEYQYRFSSFKELRESLMECGLECIAKKFDTVLHSPFSQEW